jgi:hypothetical protein
VGNGVGAAVGSAVLVAAEVGDGETVGARVAEADGARVMTT